MFVRVFNVSKAMLHGCGNEKVWAWLHFFSILNHGDCGFLCFFNNAEVCVNVSGGRRDQKSSPALKDFVWIRHKQSLHKPYVKISQHSAFCGEIATQKHEIQSEFHT